MPAAYHVSGSPIWLICLETECDDPTVFGVYFNDDDDDALEDAAREMMHARTLDADCHPVCTSSNPSERRRRDSVVSESHAACLLKSGGWCFPRHTFKPDCMVNDVP